MSHFTDQCPDAVAAPNRAYPAFTVWHALVLLLEYMAAFFIGGWLVTWSMALYAMVVHGLVGEPASFSQPTPASAAIRLSVGYAIAVGIIVWQTRRWARELLGDGSAVGIAWRRPPASSLAVAAVAGALLAGAVIGVMFWFAPPASSVAPTPLEQLTAGAMPVFIVLVVLVIVVAPLFEEFLFRGVLFAAVARRWGVPRAIGITTCAFVAVHVPGRLHYWPGLVAVAVLALINCALRLRYRSLAPGIASHCSYNLALLVVGVTLG